MMSSLRGLRHYIVDLEKYTCDCPDYRRANSNPRLRVKLPCKHILAAESAARQLEACWDVKGRT